LAVGSAVNEKIKKAIIAAPREKHLAEFGSRMMSLALINYQCRTIKNIGESSIVPFNAFVIIRGIECGNRKFLVSWLLSGYSWGDRRAIDINAG
jgi:hypothetical protein